jgi:hypothetical protein
MDGSRTSVNDLAKACAHSADAAEWGEFLRRCTPLASLVAMRISRSWVNVSSPATVSDIVQEIFLKLCEQERRILGIRAARRRLFPGLATAGFQLSGERLFPACLFGKEGWQSGNHAACRRWRSRNSFER